MLQYSQHIEQADAPIGEKDVARGTVAQLDDLLQLDFVKVADGGVMVRMHPTDRSLANLVAVKGDRVTILAVVAGHIRATAKIPEYIAMPVVDVKPYEPPAGGWGAPTPLDDLLNSGIVKKG